MESLTSSLDGEDPGIALVKYFFPSPRLVDDEFLLTAGE